MRKLFRLIILPILFLAAGCQSSIIAGESVTPPSAIATALLVSPYPSSPSPSASPTPPPDITLAFTGVIVPARCVQAAIDVSGDYDYPYQNVREILSAAHLAIGTLNTGISDYPPHTGCEHTFLLVGGTQNIDAMGRAGFDMLSVATNHIKDCGLNFCGDRVFFDMLAALDRVGILPIGAGDNLADAMQPVVVDIQGVRFGFVSLGMVNTAVFATEDSPGIAVLTEENLRAAIAAARQVSDVVVAMPHWGAEFSAVPTYVQIELAQVAAAAGADLVVGNHTHVVQGLGEINGVPIFYGLGNFIFDQTWSPETRQGVILLVHFRGAEYVGYELIPTRVDIDGLVHLADEAEAAEILARIEQASDACPGDC